MVNRAGRDWAVIAVTLVGLPAVLGAGFVWALVSVVDVFGDAVEGVVSCPEEETRLAADLSRDPAVSALEERFPDHQSAQHACGADDDTVYVDLRFRTRLPRRDSVRLLASLMESHDWRSVGTRGRCFTKVIDDRPVWAVEFVSVEAEGAGKPTTVVGLLLNTASRCQT